MGKVELNQSQLRGVIRVATRSELDQAADDLKRACQEECPVQTGRLLQSHRVERAGEDKRIISASTPYARLVYDGDGPQGRRRPNRWMQRAVDRSRIG